MSESFIISGFQPGMHSDIVPQDRDNNVMDLSVNLESLPGRGIRVREPFSGYVKNNVTGGYRISDWCLFDGAVWFVVTEGSDSTVGLVEVTDRIYRLKNGLITRADASVGGYVLVQQDSGLTRNFKYPWKMVSTGDSIVFTTGSSFFDGTESHVAPFYITRRITETGSSYFAHTVSISSSDNYGEGIKVSVIPYIDTPPAPGCLKTEYASFWESPPLDFSQTLYPGERIRVVLTAVVGEAEVLLYDMRLETGVTEVATSPMGSCRAVRIEIPSTASLPADSDRIRYYRAIGGEGMGAPQLVAEWPVPYLRAADRTAMSIVGESLQYSRTNPGTQDNALSGGISMFYTCSPTDYAGCPMARGWPNPLALWPGSVYMNTFASWPAASMPYQKNYDTMGHFPWAGLMPLVAWWPNPEKTTFEHPMGIGTLGRNAGYLSDPRYRGMFKPEYSISDANTRRVWNTGSSLQEGALMWTGQPSFITATSQCGLLDVGETAPVIKSSHVALVYSWSPDFFPDAISTTKPDFGGLAADGAIHGVSQGNWQLAAREMPTTLIGSLNYWPVAPLSKSITAAQAGSVTVYMSDAAMTFTYTYADEVSGYGRLVSAMTNVDSTTKGRAHFAATRFGLGWVGDHSFASGPVDHLNMALPMREGGTQIGDSLTLVQPHSAARHFFNAEPYGGTYFNGLRMIRGEDGIYEILWVGHAYPLYTNPMFPEQGCVVGWVTPSSGEGNDLYVTVEFHGIYTTLLPGYTTPTIGNFVIGLSGPWAAASAGLSIDTKTFTHIPSGSIPGFRVTMKIRNALYDPELLMNPGNKLSVAVKFNVNDGSVTYWGVDLHPNFSLTYVENGSEQYPYLYFWKDANNNLLFSRGDYLSVQSRFMFYKPAYVTADLDTNDHAIGNDYGFGLPIALKTHVTDYDLGTTTNFTQAGVNDKLYTDYHGGGSGSSHMKRYREACIQDVFLGTNTKKIVGFKIRGEFKNFVEALGYVGMSVKIYTSDNNEVGAGPYVVASVSVTPTGDVIYLTILGNTTLTSDGDWATGQSYRLVFERPSAGNMFIIDDLFDSTAGGVLYNDYDQMGDTSYGHFAEVDGRTYFGSIKSEINPSESGKSFIRWNDRGGVRPDLGFDRIRTDSPLRGMVGADNGLWVFTDKSLSGYSHSGDLPSVAFRFVGQTVSTERHILVYEDKVYFINTKGFYRVSREGLEELSYSNRDAFRRWIADVGIDNITFGLNHFEGLIYLNACVKVASENVTGPYLAFVYDTKSGTMQYLSWNTGAPAGNPAAWTFQAPTWEGFSTHLLTNVNKGLVSLHSVGDELLAGGYFKPNGGYFGYHLITQVDAGSEVLAGQVDYGFAIRKKLVIGDPDMVKILRQVLVKLKYGATVTVPIIVALTSDVYRGATTGANTVLVTISTNTNTITQTECRMPFKELSMAIRGAVQSALPPIEFIKLEFENYSNAGDGVSYGAYSTIYFG